MTQTRTTAVVAILILSTVSWRHGAYYEGGFDAVVAAKAFLGCVALALSAWWSVSRIRVRVASLAFLVVYLSVSILGALGSAALAPSIVLATRVALIAVSMELLRRSTGSMAVVTTVARVSLVIAFFCAGTGFVSWSPAGRLGGGIPPLTPNELAFFSAVAAIYIFWILTTEKFRPYMLIVFVALLAIIWLTESRTSLASVGGAMVLLFVLTRRRHPLMVATVLFMVPAAYYVAVYTDVITSYLARGGVEHLGTFSNRTLAWQSAFSDPPNMWATFFGQGLAVKEVQVVARFWDTQPLDSSWASAVVQGGWIGLVVIAIWTVATGLQLRKMDPRVRPLGIAFYLYLVSRSILESGLFDATAAFMLFYVLSFSADYSKSNGARVDRYSTSAQASQRSRSESLA